MGFSLKMLRCRARALPSLYGYAAVVHFYSATYARAHKDRCACAVNVKYRLACEKTSGLLLIMPPSASEQGMPAMSSCCTTKAEVCKSCEHVCRAKRKAKQNCLTKPITKRAIETSEQTVHRRERDDKHKVSIRASKTSEQTIMPYCAEGFALQCSSSNFCLF